MKIVFEIYGTPQVSLTGRAYASSADQPPEWHGMLVEGLVVDGDEDGQGDGFYIEGDAKALRATCIELLAQLDALEAEERERFESRSRRYIRCTRCQRWMDPTEDWHVDKSGDRCFTLSIQRT